MSSTRIALNARFTVVTPHPTVRGKYMVVTSERPCAGCSHGATMCAYILSPLGQHIYKASKCTHCATTGTRCGQAGALYRFNKKMTEGHLIDPRTSSDSEDARHHGGGDDSSSPSTSSEPESSELDSGNEASVEDGIPSSANTSAEAAHGSMGSPHTQTPHTPSHPHTVPSQERQERERRRNSAPTPPARAPGRVTPPPPPLRLDKTRPHSHPQGPDDRLLRPESPGKSVRFALPPSPPLSNTSPTAATSEHGHAHGHGRGNGAGSHEKGESVDQELHDEHGHGQEEQVPAGAGTSPTRAAMASSDEAKLRGILHKLATLEVRLGCLEGVNAELRRENRQLQRKNATLKGTMAVLRTSHKASGDALARALKLVDDVEKDRRRLLAELK